MVITRARLKPNGKPSEYISIKGRIKGLIEKNRNNEEVFEFVINDNGRISSKIFGHENINAELIGKTIPIIDNSYCAIFNNDGTIDIVVNKN